MESDAWIQFSENYDEKVFSLTSIPQRRKQILENLKQGKVLNLGCGSAHYLNVDLVKQRNIVVATDFCQAMLDVAQPRFTHPNLTYLLADSRNLPFEDFEFDSVVSVNSILPPERKDVNIMAEEVYRVLKKNGVFVAFLCSYDNVKKAKRDLNLEIELDDEQMRVMDTTGWQCFHTPDSIEELMKGTGFSDYKFNNVFLKTRKELNEFRRLYGVDTSKCLSYEYLLVARK